MRLIHSGLRIVYGASAGVAEGAWRARGCALAAPALLAAAASSSSSGRCKPCSLQRLCTRLSTRLAYCYGFCMLCVLYARPLLQHSVGHKVPEPPEDTVPVALTCLAARATLSHIVAAGSSGILRSAVVQFVLYTQTRARLFACTVPAEVHIGGRILPVHDERATAFS